MFSPQSSVVNCILVAILHKTNLSLIDLCRHYCMHVNAGQAIVVNFLITLNTCMGKFRSVIFMIKPCEYDFFNFLKRIQEVSPSHSCRSIHQLLKSAKLNIEM